MTNDPLLCLGGASASGQEVLKVYNSLTRRKVCSSVIWGDIHSCFLYRRSLFHCLVVVSRGTVVDLLFMMLLTWAMPGMPPTTGHPLCVPPPLCRSYITFDILRRVISNYFNYDVFYVMNITDVDDKIIRRGRRNHLLAQYTPSSLESLRDDLTQALAAYSLKVDTETDPDKKKMLSNTLVGALYHTVAYIVPWLVSYHGLYHTMACIIPWLVSYHGLYHTMACIIPWLVLSSSCVGSSQGVSSGD